MENATVDKHYQLDLLREFISYFYEKKEGINKNAESQKEYLLLTSKLCELGNYQIIKSAPRYIFEIHQDGICVRDLVFKSNDTTIPYDKIMCAKLKDGYYALSMSWCFGFTITEEEVYSLDNIIKLNQK